MGPVELGVACTSCPDGVLMIDGEYVYCPQCDRRDMDGRAGAEGAEGAEGEHPPQS